VAPRLLGDNQSLALDLALPLREAREQFEREYLLHQLKLAQGSVGRMAKVVGLERTHLYRKLRALGVDPKDAE
jgi:DNA-binding NtrC family response regulator